MGEGVDGWAGVRRGRMGPESAHADNGPPSPPGCRVPSDGHPPDSWPPALVLWLYLWVSLQGRLGGSLPAVIPGPHSPPL